MIVSDYNAIAELIKHGVAADLVDAAVLALKAGVDIDMMADAYRKGLPKALERGRVTIEEIDACVRRVLPLKEQLGLFDDPYRRGATPEARGGDRRAPRAGARRRAQGGGHAEEPARRPALACGREGTRGHRPAGRRKKRDGGPWWAPANTSRPSACSPACAPRCRRPTSAMQTASRSMAGRQRHRGRRRAVHGVDAVLLCLGERATMSGEAASRATPALPGRQQDLAEAVTAVRTRSACPSSPSCFRAARSSCPGSSEHADALLAAWFLGAEAGHAIADMVTGRVSPGGRTPMSWPRAVGQVPIYFGQRPTGRPMNPADHYTSKYQDVDNTPLYAFGHGLTYGRFCYDELQVEPRRVREQDLLTISVRLRNVGAHEAEETVFLFIRDKVSRVTRPLLELKGYAKLRLVPGETGSVTLELPAIELRYLGPDLQPVFEAGEVEILVGPSAEPTELLRQTIELC